jgi:hypothetical protein
MKTAVARRRTAIILWMELGGIGCPGKLRIGNHREEECGDNRAEFNMR